MFARCPAGASDRMRRKRPLPAFAQAESGRSVPTTITSCAPASEALPAPVVPGAITTLIEGDEATRKSQIRAPAGSWCN